MERPDFDSINSFEEFSKYYWYREDLVKICKDLGLKASGSKIELNNVIKAYLSGEKILPEKMKWNLNRIEVFGFFKDIVTMIRTVRAVMGKNYE